jgi:hypothetical protein
MTSSGEPLSTTEVRQFMAECLREHHAMQCYVKEEALWVLPISLSDDDVVVMPIATGYAEVTRRRTLKLNSIEEPRISKLEVRVEHLKRVRLAIKHVYPVQITYLNESGKEVEGEIDWALREEGDFLIGDGVRIRIQWISQVSFSLPDYKNDEERCKLPGLVNELIEDPDHTSRQFGLFLASGLPREQHFCILQKLSTDSHSDLRAAAADATRSFTARTRRTVQGKHYTFVAETQEPRIFDMLRALAVDESSTVRLKVAYALGDHRYAQARSLLDDLLGDSSEEVKKAAEHAKTRVNSQQALADECESRRNQSRPKDANVPRANDET